MKYEFFPEVFLRAPFYSFHDYDVKNLDQILLSDEFKTALFLATPTFFTILQKKDFNYSLLSEKEILSLRKYYNRMCFRTTPFGSFSSFTNILWKEDTAVNLKSKEHVKLKLFLDQKILLQVLKYQQKMVPQSLMLNPTCYQVGNYLCFIKTITDHNGSNEYRLDAIEAEEFNFNLFQMIQGKTSSKTDLLFWMQKEAECTVEEAEDYLNFLVYEQFILMENSGHVIDLSNIPYSWTTATDPDLSKIVSLKEKMSNITYCYHRIILEIADSLKTSLPKIGVEIGNEPFYSACERPALNGGLDVADQVHLLEAVDVLKKIVQPSGQPNMEKFISDFKARYDQEKIPLLTALDSNTGLGYADDLNGYIKGDDLDTILFPARNQKIPNQPWTELHRLIMKLWFKDDGRDHYSPIILNANDLNKLKDQHSEEVFPPTVSLMFRKSEDLLTIDSFGGATANSLIGRFTLFSDEVADLTRKISDAESQAHNDVIFADIEYLSDSHVDNINRRLQIYDYVIPVNTYSALPLERQINPNDLIVSVSGNRVILESKRLNRRVIPRLATAYNFNKSPLTIFRFLCDLQFDGLKSNFQFDLERLFPEMNFYPSIQFGRIEISQAKWILKETDLVKIQNQTGSGIYNAIVDLRNAIKLPRHVMFGQYDQQLVFDLESEIECSFFLDCIKREKKIVLKEFKSPDNSVMVDGKRFVNQFIAFLKHDKQVYFPTAVNGTPVSSLVPRSFIPGTMWLYIKLFCTPLNADRLLVDTIGPIVEQNIIHIKKWFFIRYSEGGNHLRVRINANVEYQVSIMAQIAESLEIKKNLHMIKSYQLDTYTRELERYGSDVIDHVEDVFCTGSELIVTYLDLKVNNEIMLTHIQIALLIILKMTQIAYIEMDKQTNFVNKVAEAFHNEFLSDKKLKLDIDQKYRKIRSEIEDVLTHDADLSKYDGKLGDTFTIFLNTWQDLTTQVPNERRVEILLADLIHMQINRLFSLEQRKYELLLYHCLSKYLQSKRARLKKHIVVSDVE